MVSNCIVINLGLKFALIIYLFDDLGSTTWMYVNNLRT